MGGRNDVRRGNRMEFGTAVLATAVACALPFVLIGQFPGFAYVVFGGPQYLSIHNLVELFSVVVSFSIFGMGWFALSSSGDRRAFVLASAFFLVGAFDLLHSLSFPGMPDFVSPSSTNKGILFWEAARLSAALGLSIAAFLPKEGPAGIATKGIVAVLGMIILGVASLAFLFLESSLPQMFVQGTGLTPLKVGLEYLVMAGLVVALLGFGRHPLAADAGGQTLLVSAIVLGIAGEFAFTLYKSAYDSYNLLGHIFKLLSYSLLYRAVFVASVTAPYARLRESEESLRQENELRTRSEETLARTNRELTVIHECNQAIVRATDESALVAEVCRIICDTGGYSLAWVGYIALDGSKNIIPQCSAGNDNGYIAGLNLAWDEGPQGIGPTGTCIRENRPCYVQDFLIDPRLVRWRALAEARGFRSLTGLPLKVGDDKPFGALTLYSTEPNAFSETEIRLLEELAGDLAFGIFALRSRERNQSDAERIRDALRDKEALIRELHHRTRNNMQVISSMLCLDSERLESEADRRVFDSLDSRIRSMALVHQKLYQSGDLNRIELRSYIESLCALMLESSDLDPDQIVFDFDSVRPVEVLIDIAVPLGIVLSELLANALKHAFPSRRKGRIALSLDCADGNLVKLGFADDGVGFDAGDDPRGPGRSGITLVYELVTLQLGGTVTCRSQNGTSWTIAFPANRYHARV